MISCYEAVHKLLRGVSGWVWNEQVDAFANNIKLSEIAITDYLLYRFKKESKNFNIKTIKYTGHEESIYGADWEWYFDLPFCKIGYRIQAKKLYKNERRIGKYGSLVLNGCQTNKLISRSGENFPIFVFYNHDKVMDAEILSKNRYPSRFKYQLPSYWGCSFAVANFVRKSSSNELRDLARGMHPLFKLIDINCFDQNGLIIGGPDPSPEPTEKMKYVTRLLSNYAEFNNSREQLDTYLVKNKLYGIALIDGSKFIPSKFMNFKINEKWIYSDSQRFKEK